MNEGVIILGMHRSGTSCLTGCLKEYGLHLGKVSESNKHNKKGNQENKEIFKLNETLLNYNKGSWKKPPIKPLTWNQELEITRNQIIYNYGKLPKPWGIKDPRMLLTYEFWQSHLPNHQLVGTIRHPEAVTKSLLARKHKNLIMPKEQAYNLWQLYNEKLIKLYDQQTFPIINFDLEPSLYFEKINIIRSRLNMNEQDEVAFFDKNLINQNSYSRNDCPENLLPLYDKLIEVCI